MNGERFNTIYDLKKRATYTLSAAHEISSNNPTLKTTTVPTGSKSTGTTSGSISSGSTSLGTVIQLPSISHYPVINEPISQIYVDKSSGWLQRVSPYLLTSYITNASRVEENFYSLETKSLDSFPIVLIYLSASWCPPCKIFTQKLNFVYNAIKTYENWNETIEVILLNFDDTETSYQKYCKEINFLAIPYEASKKYRNEILDNTEEKLGFPSLCILNQHTGEIKRNLRMDIETLYKDAMQQNSKEDVQVLFANYFSKILRGN